MFLDFECLLAKCIQWVGRKSDERRLYGMYGMEASNALKIIKR